MRPVRRSPRLHGFDYARWNAYFLTFNTFARARLFGVVRKEGLVLSPAGEIVDAEIRSLPARYAGVRLDAAVVMPDHVHLLVTLSLGAPAVTELVRRVKSVSARIINARRGTMGSRVWHRSFYDRIVRDEKEWCRIRHYIERNPAAWWARYGEGPR